ncbi:MAG: ATP-binding protein [Simkania negevensis]|nr:ATP-binding protein [Simkania negevensis]
MYRHLEKSLAKWKESTLRYPLLIRGARQVGKTYLVEQFGRREFQSFVSVNFEFQPQAIACFESLNPSDILLRLQIVLKEAIIPGKTLLFLDEIQACPQAILALRYFKEKLPELHVIGAGSLLEFALIKGKFSFPVGRVQFLYLKPLSFQEFVLAKNKSSLLEECTHCSLENPPSSQTHDEMIFLTKEYFLTGGMPAAVSAFCKSGSLLESAQIQDILLDTYKADFSKYASEAEQKYLKILFEGIPNTIGQQFKYSKIDPHIRSRELKYALDQLQWASLIQPIYSSSAAGIPLSAQIKRNKFKLLFLDIGLIERALKIDPSLILSKEPFQINSGALAEQFVGQELFAYFEDPLFYWEREKTRSDAEVDYLFTIDQHIIPIEVKAATHGKLKSLFQFMEEKKSLLGVQISRAPLSFKENLLSVPFYLIGELPRLIKFDFLR